MSDNDLNSLLKFKKAVLGRWLRPDALLELADIDNDGSVSIDEFKKLLGSFGISFQQGEGPEHLFKQLDASGDGFINLEEFSNALANTDHLMHKVPEDVLNDEASLELQNYSKYIALVAHNQTKEVLINFVADHLIFFNTLPLVTTGSTGRALKGKLGIDVQKLVASGPLGGDQAIGGMISEGKISAIFFFKDPLSPHPHAADIEALTRLCDVHQIPYATNGASARGLMMSIQTLGLEWEMHEKDSHIVEKYKESQQSVISSHAKS